MKLQDNFVTGDVTIKTLEDILNEDIDMIVKKKGSYYVYSKDKTKVMGGPYKTRQEALIRLGEIEYFKTLHKKK